MVELCMMGVAVPLVYLPCISRSHVEEAADSHTRYPYPVPMLPDVAESSSSVSMAMAVQVWSHLCVVQISVL